MTTRTTELEAQLANPELEVIEIRILESWPSVQSFYNAGTTLQQSLKGASAKSRLWTRAFALAAALCSGACAAPRPPRAAGAAHWTTDTTAAWVAMQHALVGDWEATVDAKRSVRVSYRIVSKGSALLETFTTASGTETVTLYHRDGPTLMLTHYCAQGNQARLKAVAAGPKRVVFAYLDATNTADDQGVMHELVITMRPDGFDQESVYRESNGELESTTLHFVRAD